MLTTLLLTAALSLGQCRGGHCALPSAGGFGGWGMPAVSFYAPPPPMSYAPVTYAPAPPVTAYAPPVTAYVPPARTAAAPSFRWSMPDDSGKWWGNDDLAHLVAHVDRVNQRLAERPPVLATRRVLWP